MGRVTKERVNLLEFHRDRAFRDIARLTERIDELEVQVAVMQARIAALEAQPRWPIVVPQYPIWSGDPGAAQPLWTQTKTEDNTSWGE